MRENGYGCGMTETELEFHWNGEVIERTEKHRGAKGAFVNWRHVVLALQREPRALSDWLAAYREAMFPAAHDGVGATTDSKSATRQGEPRAQTT